MENECVINADNIQTISKRNVGSFVTHFSKERMDEVFEAIRFAFGFDK